MVTLVFIVVCTVFLAVGLATGRAKSGEAQDAAMLITARRRFPMWLACLTLAATWIGGGYINGTAEAIYDPARGLVWCQAPWCYALSLIFGGLVFAKPMRTRGYQTMLDLFEDRYGKQMAATLFIPALIGDLFWTAAILSALGATLGKLFGIDSALAIGLSTAVVVAYTVFGGLWSVACSDVVQLACIVFGLAVTVPYALEASGGWQSVQATYLLQMGDQARLFPRITDWYGHDPWAWRWLDSALLLVLGGIPWQVYFQRILACRTSGVAVGMSFLGGFICLAVALVPALLGAVGVSIDWSQYGNGIAPVPSEILPHILRYVLPPVASLLGLMAVVAAVMASTDSSILASASLFTWNVYRPLRQISDHDPRLPRMLRWSIVVMGVLAVALAVKVKSVYELWFLSSDLVYVILFPQLVMGLFFRRVTRTGAVAGVAVAVVARSVIFALNQSAVAALVGQVDWPRFVSYVPWLTMAMLSSLLTTALVSLLSGQSPAERTNASELWVGEI